MASLAAALLGGQPLVSLLGDGQTDSLSSGQGHPRLVALETGCRKQEFVNVDQRERPVQVAKGWNLRRGPDCDSRLFRPTTFSCETHFKTRGRKAAGSMSRSRKTAVALTHPLASEAASMPAPFHSQQSEGQALGSFPDQTAFDLLGPASAHEAFSTV